MFAIKLDLLLFLMTVHVSDCQRRIKDGEVVSTDKKYVVYLVKAPNSELIYDYWLCGGAIVSSEFVITSAACVNDVDYLYVIAGYKKYVPDDQIEIDPCTKNKKKKVVYTCSPRGYELKYEELDYWSYIDIALVKVESPYDFSDESYTSLCSYIPTTIPINYEAKHQEAGTDAMVLGWGHKEAWRRPGDHNNYNEEILRYAPTLLLNKTTCMERYEDYTNMSEVIDTYMICSLGKGNLNDAGQTITKTVPLANGCTTRQQKVLGFEGVSCEAEADSSDVSDFSDEDEDFASLLDNTRKNVRLNQTYNDSMIDVNETFDSNNNEYFRRNGICQNDHGGPLVTWVGAREILIGIASVFKVSDHSDCMGPYLYTSTLCTGLFLDCILTSSELPDITPTNNNRRDLCDRPASEKGYETIEKTISWKDHPAGPADNEKYGRSGPEKKFPTEDKFLASKKYTESERYSENKKYERHALNERYPAVENYPAKEKYSANVRKPLKEKYPANERDPTIVKYPANDRYHTKGKNPANDRYPMKEKYLSNNRNPAKEKYAGNERQIGFGKFPFDQAPTIGHAENTGYAMRPQRPLNI